MSPNNPARKGASSIIGCLLLLSIIVVPVAGIWYFTFWLARPKNIQNGIPATAIIQKVHQGNRKVTINNNEFYQLVMDVKVTDKQGDTWPAQMKEMIHLLDIAKMQEGNRLKVQYDPNDKSNVAILREVD